MDYFKTDFGKNKIKYKYNDKKRLDDWDLYVYLLQNNPHSDKIILKTCLQSSKIVTLWKLK
jgi:hypothetical protein